MDSKKSGVELALLMSMESRELLLRAIGMLEGAAWIAEGKTAHMLDGIADMIRDAIGMAEKE